MGKGDKKTKRGKIVNGSYGKVRRRKKPRIKYKKPAVAEVTKKENVVAQEEKSKIKKPIEKKPSIKKTTTAAKSEKKGSEKPTAKKIAVADPKKNETDKPKVETET